MTAPDAVPQEVRSVRDLAAMLKSDAHSCCGYPGAYQCPKCQRKYEAAAKLESLATRVADALALCDAAEGSVEFMPVFIEKVRRALAESAAQSAKGEGE